jgi:hypothetical protein
MRLAAGAGETIGLFLARPDGLIDCELQLDRFVKLSVELNLADIAVRSSGDPAQRMDQLISGRTTVRAKDLPAEIEQTASRGVQKQGEDIPAIRIPLFGNRKRANVGQFDVGGLPDESFEQFSPTTR